MSDSNPSDRESEKRERFLRIAEKRTTAVLQKLRVLGNCANRGTYSYTDADIQKIRRAIEEQLDRTLARFETTKEPRFKF
ncbi:MAG: hypothetical protein ACYSX0_22940 [Planctomycetota bacterium]|jgi:hypothetical protein